MIRKVKIHNYKSFRDSTVEFDSTLNILVGDNEAGKSTLLEAIYLAGTGHLNGKYLFSSLSSHLINSHAVEEYVRLAQSGTRPPLPEMYIELYLSDSDATSHFRGRNNSLREDAVGLSLRAIYNPEFATEYEVFLENPLAITSLPIEYYTVQWISFDGSSRYASKFPLNLSLIDASRIRLANGTDYFLQRIIADSLTPSQRSHLSQFYREQMNAFGNSEAIGSINAHIDERKEDITGKRLEMAIDSSMSSSWESALSPYLDDLPVHYSGAGEQSKLKILLALSREASGSQVILLEEPENHLSFSSLNQLIGRIGAKYNGRQVIMTTHSSFVVNKLGLSQLKLLSLQTVSTLTELPPDTYNYFRKLPGYDTLRMVLAKKVILVEGPSDELIVQRAYLDVHGCRPIEHGIDIIAMRGLAFRRFLDIAVALGRRTLVVADNDGNPTQVASRFRDYDQHQFITVCIDVDASLQSLEPQLVRSAGPATIADVLERPVGSTEEDLVTYMSRAENKTECALKIHDSAKRIAMPSYILRATGNRDTVEDWVTRQPRKKPRADGQDRCQFASSCSTAPAYCRSL